jgi:hypothetical protein
MKLGVNYFVRSCHIDFFFYNVEYMFTLITMQGDSIGRGPELIISNYAVIYQLLQNLVGTYHYNCVVENVQIGILESGETGLMTAYCILVDNIPPHRM